MNKSRNKCAKRDNYRKNSRPKRRRRGNYSKRKGKRRKRCSSSEAIMIHCNQKLIACEK